MAGRMSFQIKVFFFPEVQNGTRGTGQENYPAIGIHSLFYSLSGTITQGSLTIFFLSFQYDMSLRR